MREMDTESPVIWPAWCYSAETGGEGDTPSIPLIPVSTHLSQTSIKSRSRRRENAAAATTASPGDLTVASLVAATAKMSNGNLPDYTSPHNNNNSVKSERLSPAGSHSATTPDNSSSRSRSVTPSSSSIPGTPPASASAAAAAGVSNIEHAAMAAASLSGRNYSDFMRSLAAKYNNSNPNEYFLNSTIRNGLMDPRGFIQNMKANNPYAPNNLLATNNNNKDVHHPPSESNQITPNNIKKLENLFNNPQNPIPLFPPMIDMSSTQALLAIVRQVKQDEQQKGLKRNSSVLSPSASPTVVSAGAPLDLTSSAIVSKRAKLKVKQSDCPELKAPVKNSPGSSVPLVSNCCSTSTSPRLCLGQCATSGVTEVQRWSVDDVVTFVSSIDICQEYAESFREQRVDGAGLPLLTEDHLMNVMGMKLGPALKLKSLLLRKMGSCALCLHCSHCHERENSGNNSSVSGSPSSPNNKRPNSNSP